jgi:superfamily II DNA or RNA helicase
MATKVKNKVSGNKPSDKTVTKKNDRSLYITNDGTYIMKNSFEIDELDILKKELNILPKVTNDFAIEKNEPFDIFLEGTDKLYIPKFYGLKKFDNIKNTVTPNNPLNFTFNGDLRDYQKEIVNIVLPKIKKDGGGLLSVPTGRGKTVLGLYLATQLKCRTLIIVHKEFLMNQWNERIRQYTNCTIGKIQQNKVDIDKDIVIGMLQSISMKDYDVDIFSKFDFVIFDECHHLSSRVFSQALLKLNTPYTLGLSATPNRSDKTEKVFYWFLGEMMYKEETPLAHKVKVEVHNYTIKDRKFRDAIGKNGKSIQPIVISNLSTIDRRNAYIYDQIYNLKEKDPSRKLLILSGRIDQLKTLNEMLKVVFEGDIGFYIGGMKEKDLKISESKDLILATYEMVSEGLDIQALDTMVMCTPKGNINQIVGRILRKKPEDYENQPLIIDIIDHIPSMLILGFIRKRLYIQRKYEIIIKDINENQELKSQEYDYSKEIKIVKCNEGFIDSDDEKVEKEVKEKIEDEKKDALDLVEKEVKGEVKKVKGVKKEVKVTLKKKVQETNSFIDDD